MRIGIIGAGQLGRMLALAGMRLGLDFSFYSDTSDCPCKDLGPLVVGQFSDSAGIVEFCRSCDVITYEFENVPVGSATAASVLKLLYPPPRALEVAQDRLTEKEFFRSLGIPTAPFKPVSSLFDLKQAASELQFPCVLKTRRMGYDGKGQAVLRTSTDTAPAWTQLSALSSDLILEGFVGFDRELSCIAARGISGEICVYDLFENHHKEGILRRTYFPAKSDSSVPGDYLSRILKELSYVGVAALELFEVKGAFVANEMAPRVHNSGHITMDTCVTDQFEQHIRAIAGLPLGSAEVRNPGVMLNLIGNVPPLEELTGEPDLKVHLYGKDPRPGRKVGHVNVLGENGRAELLAKQWGV